jgi:hypothetical protein
MCELGCICVITAAAGTGTGFLNLLSMMRGVGNDF